MKRIFGSILITAFSVATVCAGGKSGSINESGTTPNIQPKVEKHLVKPVRWFRRIGAVDVQFPLWLSSRGIPDAKTEMETPGQSYRFAVRPDVGGAQTLPEVEP
ncbi:MAG: hypothetical protein M3Z85_16690 [Acidobacteriota bacterium]|nr:hypothetical protein [Acidobacteriota bacterium]